MIEFKLDGSLKMMADGLQEIAKSVMRPYSRECDENEHSDPKAYIESMYNMFKNMGGLGGTSIYGGKNAEEGQPKKARSGNLQSMHFIERLAWGDCGMYLATPMPLLGGAAVGATGTPEQKKRFLTRFKEGEPKWAAMAITEPGTGSDSASIQTTATLDGDEWVINGEKIFVTAGKRAVVDSEGFLVVWATVDRNAGRAGIKPFVVEHGTPGMTVVKLEHKHGIRCSDTAAIVFEDCRIPRNNLLGPEEVAPSKDSKGFKGAMATFDATRPAVAASACGVGRASLELIQEKLAEKGFQPRYGLNPQKLTHRERELMMMQAKYKACWLLTLKSAWMADMGKPNNLEASIAKCKAGRDMVDLCQKAVEMMGPEGYSRKLMFEKWMRDAKIGDIYEGTQNINKLVVARRILGYTKADLQ